jgi:hypothetical protein
MPAGARGRDLTRRLLRCVLPHLAAYPIALLWAVASMPLTIHLFARELLAQHDDVQAFGMFVVRRVAWPASVAFVLPHFLAIPWVFGRNPGLWRRWTWVGIAALAALGLAVGGASWGWLLSGGHGKMS